MGRTESEIETRELNFTSAERQTKTSELKRRETLPTLITILSLPILTPSFTDSRWVLSLWLYWILGEMKYFGEKVIFFGRKQKNFGGRARFLKAKKL